MQLNFDSSANINLHKDNLYISKAVITIKF